MASIITPESKRGNLGFLLVNKLSKIHSRTLNVSKNIGGGDFLILKVFF